VLQESYGVAKDEAERLVTEWEKNETARRRVEQVLLRNSLRELA